MSFSLTIEEFQRITDTILTRGVKKNSKKVIGKMILMLNNCEYDEFLDKLDVMAKVSSLFAMIMLDYFMKENIFDDELKERFKYVKNNKKYLMYIKQCETQKIINMKSKNIITSIDSENLEIEETKGMSDIDTQLMITGKKLQLLKSAKSRGLDFNLSDTDIKKLLERKKCFYTNVVMTSDSSMTQRTIDRIDNTKGYIKGNVVACTYQSNQLKNNLIENDSLNLNSNAKVLASLCNKLIEMGFN